MIIQEPAKEWRKHRTGNCGNRESHGNFKSTAIGEFFGERRKKNTS
jgi:hypothetical protein